MIKSCLFGFSQMFWGVSSNIETITNKKQRIYFANHTSHLDTITLLTALPCELRAKTQPVAAADYWGKNALNRYISKRILNCVLIDRERKSGGNPLDVVFSALETGNSVIIFPEGTRGFNELPDKFKAGLYHIHKKYPDVDLVPAYLNNVNRSMPKGQLIPVPLICTIKFGQPLDIIDGEDKEVFLERARQSVIGLK